MTHKYEIDYTVDDDFPLIDILSTNDSSLNDSEI
jgi:hypothetical protein